MYTYTSQNFPGPDQLIYITIKLTIILVSYIHVHLYMIMFKRVNYPQLNGEVEQIHKLILGDIISSAWAS